MFVSYPSSGDPTLCAGIAARSSGARSLCRVLYVDQNERGDEVKGGRPFVIVIVAIVAIIRILVFEESVEVLKVSWMNMFTPISRQLPRTAPERDASSHGD